MSNLSIDSPSLHGALSKRLNSHEISILDCYYNWSVKHGAMNEMGVRRSPDASFNPQPARIASLSLHHLELNQLDKCLLDARSGGQHNIDQIKLYTVLTSLLLFTELNRLTTKDETISKAKQSAGKISSLIRPPSEEMDDVSSSPLPLSDIELCILSAAVLDELRHLHLRRLPECGSLWPESERTKRAHELSGLIAGRDGWLSESRIKVLIEHAAGRFS